MATEAENDRKGAVRRWILVLGGVVLLSVAVAVCLCRQWYIGSPGENIVDCDILHFSVDDVTQVCANLQDGRLASAFDEPTLCKLKEWHDKYGIKASLYVQGPFLINSRYGSELCENADWLRFGYHGKGAARRKGGVRAFRRQIMDSIGCGYASDCRLDYYHADWLSCLKWRLTGNKVFFSCDDWAYNAEKRESNYYLTEEKTKLIDSVGVLVDHITGAYFVGTDFRVEQIEERFGSVENAVAGSRQSDKDVLVVFTHERLMQDEHIVQLIDSVFCVAERNGYSFSFLPYTDK